MKRIVTAIAVFLLLFSLCLTAYAEPIPTPDTATEAENPTGGTAINPFTPSGAGTVVDLATGEDGKVFYTIVAPDETVFYLVIDRQRSAENVYFLNAVTVDDLLSLAANPSPNPGTAVITPITPPTENNPTEPIPAPKQEQSGGNNMGTLIIVIVLAVLGGGAGWYFKIYKPKQQSAGADEYEPPVEDETDFDDWEDTDEDGDDDTPPWETSADEDVDESEEADE